MKDKDLIAKAMRCYKTAVEAESVNRSAALDDLRFVNGDQWPEAIRSQREREGRPCQTINKIPTFVRQVTNEARQARPAIKVHPVDSAADEDTAEVLQGLIRHIEYASHADDAYDTALESAVRIGFGYWRVITEYETPESFNQSLAIKRIRNPFMVYTDPMAQEMDGSDMQWAFLVDDMPIATFKSMYPDAAEANFSEDAVGQSQEAWLNDETIRVAEYFYYETEKAELCLLANGRALFRDELAEGDEVIKTRMAERKRVKWAKITHAEVLEKSDWPGRWIPVIPVYGDEIDIEGEITRSGIVRFAKDPQRMYNYWKTTETELVALAPKAPYIGAAGQFEGFEDMWEQANVRSFPYLEYNAQASNGQQMGAPQRQPFAGAPAGVITAALSASDDIKATTGIFDASLGSRGNETSGRAIMARQKEGDTANFHYADNQAKAIRHTGRILIDMIPYIYDAERIVRIMGEDGKTEPKEINKPLDAAEVDEKTGAIKTVLNDLTIGTYDVTVSVGQSYSTKRMESAEGMNQLIQAQPQLMQVFGDLAVKAMDWQGADEIAERLKRTIPANILGADDDAPQQLPPQVQQHIQQLEQAAQQMQQELQSIDVDMQKAQLQAQTQIEVAKINAEARGDSDELKGMVQLLLAKMPPPPILARDVATDLGKDDRSNLSEMPIQVANTMTNGNMQEYSTPVPSQDEAPPELPAGLPVPDQGLNTME